MFCVSTVVFWLAGWLTIFAYEWSLILASQLTLVTSHLWCWGLCYWGMGFLQIEIKILKLAWVYLRRRLIVLQTLQIMGGLVLAEIWSWLSAQILTLFTVGSAWDVFASKIYFLVLLSHFKRVNTKKLHMKSGPLSNGLPFPLSYCTYCLDQVFPNRCTCNAVGGTQCRRLIFF